MNTFKYKATKLIVEAFENNGVKFDIANREDSEAVIAGFSPDDDNMIVMAFVSHSNTNAVTLMAGIYMLDKALPDTKRIRLLETCNIINRDLPFNQVFLDPRKPYLRKVSVLERNA